MTGDANPLWRHDLRLADAMRAGNGESGLLCGVDEVGRGPLAGNVVAACVILDLRSRPIAGVNDSKKLSHKKRVDLAPRIREEALAFALGEASVEEIDTLNIFHASLLAMRRALEAALAQLAVSHPSLVPALVLVDGNKAIPGVSLPQKTLVGGDGLSASIAAASILAKVARDSAMDEAHELYPQYGFARHKGYATLEHRTALRSFGPCPLHRLTFSSALMNSLQTSEQAVF